MWLETFSLEDGDCQKYIYICTWMSLLYIDTLNCNNCVICVCVFVIMYRFMIKKITRWSLPDVAASTRREKKVASIRNWNLSDSSLEGKILTKSLVTKKDELEAITWN